ncbi:hypothetical protein A4H97_10215 [Niastella yeongjuensis]|uniref:Uncharacterized protein n=1 Tax=Niastella yeongjuensis TaxID=354355 RepID=A0A1V9EF19_9BACT|nr:hypothetical protein [Niastella yeongjuensis]OQP44728.1 hypothetical protein A4H97_10215 [Niastella yeongjuensis]SEO77423.1 hypothetical protein SAMN05660816_03494 [Niastella yeongjuensis]
MNSPIKLLLFTGTIYLATIGCKSEIDSNPIPMGSAATGAAQSGTFFNGIGQASFKYTRNDLFKSGKVSAPSLALAADSLIHFRDKKYRVTLKHYRVGNALFSMGSLTTNNTTVLLFTNENHLQTLEFKGTGSLEFRGVKEDKYYFRLTQNDVITSFSLSLNQPDVAITAYTVEGE